MSGWTARDLLRAQRQGAVIRSWGKDSVRYDPRRPRDPEPWEGMSDVRFSTRECHPENPDGSPWTGSQNDDHGNEEPTMDRKTLKALAEMESGDDRPGVRPLSRNDIREWAEDEGGLPAVSARPFAAWLDENFYDFNEDGEATNEQVLKGARAHWVGEA